MNNYEANRMQYTATKNTVCPLITLFLKGKKHPCLPEKYPWVEFIITIVFEGNLFNLVFGKIQLLCESSIGFLKDISKQTNEDRPVITPKGQKQHKILAKVWWKQS